MLKVQDFTETPFEIGLVEGDTDWVIVPKERFQEVSSRIHGSNLAVAAWPSDTAVRLMGTKWRMQLWQLEALLASKGSCSFKKPGNHWMFALGFAETIDGVNVLTDRSYQILDVWSRKGVLSFWEWKGVVV